MMGICSSRTNFAGRAGTFVRLDHFDGLAAERRAYLLRAEALGPGRSDVHVLEIPHHGTRCRCIAAGFAG